MSVHIYNLDDKYILFNHEQLKYFLLPPKLGEQLLKLDENEKERLISSLKENFYFNGSNEITQEEKEDDVCSRLILVISQACNLSCSYCYAHGGSYGKQSGNFFMDFETAKNSVVFFTKTFAKGIKSIQFFGGEPLLNLDLIERLCYWVNEYYSSIGLNTPKFSISTNGTLINEKAIELFNSYNIGVTVSLDGDKGINDEHRKYKNVKRSVHEDVVKIINLMNKIRNFKLGIEMTVTNKHIENFKDNPDFALGLVKHFHNLKIDFIHFAPIIGEWNSNLTIVDEKSLANFFDDFVKYSLTTISSNNPLVIDFVLRITESVVKKRLKKNLCSAGVEDFAVDVEGNIYPCFVFIGRSEDLIMGNVNDNIEEKTQNFRQKILEFKEITYERINSCANCIAKGICSQCIAASYLKFKNFDCVDNNLCSINKKIIERIGLFLVDNYLVNKI
jgi:uncharacterized protein